MTYLELASVTRLEIDCREGKETDVVTVRYHSLRRLAGGGLRQCVIPRSSRLEDNRSFHGRTFFDRATESGRTGRNSRHGPRWFRAST